MHETLILSRTCNCLIPQAEADLSMGSTASEILGLNAAAAAIEGVLNRFRAVYGGLWVGGTAELTTHSLTFRPNSMNRAVHTGDLSLRIPLADISATACEWGLVTSIVVVTTRQGHFKLRCFGAQEFREALEHARNAVQPDARPAV